VHISVSLATLDIRPGREATRHSDALDELSRYLQATRGLRRHGRRPADHLAAGELQTRRPLLPPAASCEPGHRRTFGGFSHASGCNGISARNHAGSDVISMCHTVSDCWKLMRLAKEAGPGRPKTVKHPVVGGSPVRNGEDLQRRPGSDGSAFASPSYRQLLASKRQAGQALQGSELAYSDEQQEIPASFLQQLEITQKPRSPCSRLSCQYGRGTADLSMAREIGWGRGGGAAYQAILAQPKRHQNGRIKITSRARSGVEVFLPELRLQTFRKTMDHRLPRTGLVSTSLDDTPAGNELDGPGWAPAHVLHYANSSNEQSGFSVRFFQQCHPRSRRSGKLPDFQSFRAASERGKDLFQSAGEPLGGRLDPEPFCCEWFGVGGRQEELDSDRGQLEVAALLYQRWAVLPDVDLQGGGDALEGGPGSGHHYVKRSAPGTSRCLPKQMFAEIAASSTPHPRSGAADLRPWPPLDWRSSLQALGRRCANPRSSPWAFFKLPSLRRLPGTRTASTMKRSERHSPDSPPTAAAERCGERC